jgi:hypothetical protein
MISTNSNDSMLVDRFLVLASDMPEHEKVEATLRLARTLLEKSPRKAIEIAWMVYNSSLKDADSLSLIADAFDRLGKQGKADIIRTELKRITNGSLSQDVRNLARLTVEEHITTALAGKEASPAMVLDSPSGIAETVFDLGDVSSPVNEVVNPAKPHNLNATKIVDPSATIGPGEVLLDLAMPAIESASRAVSKNKANSSPQRNDVAAPSTPRVSAVTPGAGIPEAIPPKEPSMHAIAGKSRDVKKTSEIATQASLATHSFNSAQKIPETEQLDRLEELAQAGHWDRLLGLLQSCYPLADHPYLLKYFERHNLNRIDIGFADFWLDVLIAARQERRALRFIVTRLTEEPHLAWARMALPKLHKITAIMNLSPIEWREVECD